MWCLTKEHITTAGVASGGDAQTLQQLSSPTPNAATAAAMMEESTEVSRTFLAYSVLATESATMYQCCYNMFGPKGHFFLNQQVTRLET